MKVENNHELVKGLPNKTYVEINLIKRINILFDFILVSLLK